MACVQILLLPLWTAIREIPDTEVRYEYSFNPSKGPKNG